MDKQNVVQYIRTMERKVADLQLEMKRDETGEFPGQRQAVPKDEGRNRQGGEESSPTEKWAGQGGAGSCTQLEKTDPSVTLEGWPGLARGQEKAILKKSQTTQA